MDKNVSDEQFEDIVVASSKAPPPASFYQLNIAAQEAATLAIARGEKVSGKEMRNVAKRTECSAEEERSNEIVQQ